MKNLDRCLKKFLISYDWDFRIKMSLKILKILVKKPLLVIWHPKGLKTYYGRFRAGSGADFTIILGLDEFSQYIKYWFEVSFGESRDCFVNIRHIIHSLEFSKSSETMASVEKIASVRTFNEPKLLVTHGYEIMELYNKVANQLQAVERISDL